MNDLYAKLIIQSLKELGVRRVCLSPGSRSTPLVYALAQEEALEKVVHFDERSAAYHAYGYAKGSKIPTAVVATSGTAVANLFPAVMEASLEEVPLIVLTADRPPELRDCGANQTCDQVKIFGSYVRWYFEIPCAEEGGLERIVSSTMAQAIYRATHSPKGPVHINCLFREPFLSDRDPLSFSMTHYEQSHSTLSSHAIEQWAKKLSKHEQGVIVVGSLSTPRALKPIFTLAEILDWPILTDILSGLRSEGLHHNVIPYHDLVLKIAPHLKPDCILHLGDRIVSKPLARWIEKSEPSVYALVADHPLRFDPSHCVTHRIECDPVLFCEQLSGILPRSVSWLNTWKTISQVIDGHVDEFLPSVSEPGLIRFLHHHLPPHYALFFANSMPIRDANSFFFPRFHRSPIYGKRGCSGIDGNIAAAVGIAEGAERPLVAVIGDLAALHDLNSLSYLQKSKVPVILIVVNNEGGGIFSFLPIAQKKEVFEEYFAAAHSWNFEHSAKMFNLPYQSIVDPAALGKVLRDEKSCFIEFKSNRAENFKLHQEIEQKMQEKIHALTCALT